MKYIILVLLILTLSFNLFSKPTLIISHSYAGIIESYLHLTNKGLLTKCNLVLLVHESEKELINKTKNVLDKNNISSYQIYTLKGYPTDNRFNNSWERKYLLPNPDQPRFSTHPDAIIPNQWTETFKKVFDIADGYLIPGGADIPASEYNNKQFIENHAPTALRSTYELAFLKMLIMGKDPLLKTKPRFMILGICLGCQTINVACGGTMYQSIPLEIYGISSVEDMLNMPSDLMHTNYYLMKYPPIKKLYTGWFHKISFIKEDKHFGYMEDVQVLSNHHQALKKLGYGIDVTATSVDGKIPEIYQHKIFPNIIGVQFHPEREFYWNKLKMLTPQTRTFLVGFWKKISEILKQSEYLNKLK